MATKDERLANQRGLNAGQLQLLRAARVPTIEGFEKVPEATLLRTIRRLDFPDMPGEREWFRHLQHRSTEGRTEAHPLVGALRDLDSMRLRQNGVEDIGGVPTGARVQAQALQAILPPPTAGLSRPKWKSIGPGNIGGRTRTIVIHPKTPATMWAGAAGGGIWRTDNAGTSWAPVDDFLANLAITSIVMDPANANILYAGTGEAFGNGDSLRGGGIFRTTNGTHWSQIPSTSIEAFRWITRLAIGKDGKTLLAATNQGILRSIDPQRAIWKLVLPFAVADVKFNPADPNKAVAGSLNAGLAWFSTDAGATWKSSSTGTWSGRVELAYATANPNTVYASVNVNLGEIWRSTDGGKKFSKRGGKGPDGKQVAYLGRQGWYDNAVWAGDPTTADLVIVGGIDLWRSTDGGNTLIDISTWWDPRSAHADHHAIVSHSGYNGKTNRTVFFGNDGGVYCAKNVTTVGNDPALPRVSGWQELNNTYGVTQFFGGAGSVATGTIIGGAQDNGTLVYRPSTGSEQWTRMFGGDGGFCAADPTDPKVFYGEYVYLQIHRNLDGGATDDTQGDRYICGMFWNPAAGAWQWKPIPFKIPEAETQTALFIAPFILDPNDPNRILAGGQSLWRTNDAKTPNTPTSGPSWTQIKAPAGGYISAITVAQGKPNLIWVGHDDGQLWKTDNGLSATPAWRRVDQIGPSPVTVAAYCSRILASAFDNKVVYACFSRFGGQPPGNVWRSEDGGVTWKSLGAGLPPVPVRAIAMHPKNRNLIYLGTEVGIFASDTGGNSWSATNEGPANVSVDDLFWMQETLVCVTHGRGMYTIDLANPPAPTPIA